MCPEARSSRSAMTGPALPPAPAQADGDPGSPGKARELEAASRGLPLAAGLSPRMPRGRRKRKDIAPCISHPEGEGEKKSWEEMSLSGI